MEPEYSLVSSQNFPAAGDLGIRFKFGSRWAVLGNIYLLGKARVPCGELTIATSQVGKIV